MRPFFIDIRDGAIFVDGEPFRYEAQAAKALLANMKHRGMCDWRYSSSCDFPHEYGRRWFNRDRFHARVLWLLARERLQSAYPW